MTRVPGDRQVEVVEQDGISTVRLIGDVDLANVDQIAAELAAAVPNSAVGVVVDLSKTGYLDSLGLHMLVDFAERLRLRRQDLRIAVPEDSLIRKLLRITCLDQHLAVHPTASDAREGLGGVASGHGRPG